VEERRCRDGACACVSCDPAPESRRDRECQRSVGIADAPALVAGRGARSCHRPWPRSLRRGGTPSEDDRRDARARSEVSCRTISLGALPSPSRRVSARLFALMREALVVAGRSWSTPCVRAGCVQRDDDRAVGMSLLSPFRVRALYADNPLPTYVRSQLRMIDLSSTRK